MKKLLSKALILVFGLGVAMTFTACHTGESSATKNVQTITHSVSVTVLSSDGKALANNPVVKLNGKTMVKDTEGYFFSSGLKDGVYILDITCTGYDSVSDTLTLSPQQVQGINAGMNVVKTVYLTGITQSKELGFNSSDQKSDEITLETTDHSYDDGTSANEETKSITVEAATPVVSGTVLDSIANQIIEQSDDSVNLSNYKITLRSITCLEDAQAIAKTNHVALSRMARATTTTMPNDNELLTGVGVNAGPYVITMPGDLTFDITFTIPDDVKDAVTLYRTIKGDAWTEASEGGDIYFIDTETSGKIIVKLKTIRTQSFAFGVKVNEINQPTRWENIVADPVPSSVVKTTMTMPYQVKAGVVLTNQDSSSPALTNFLRKMIIRKYGTQVVKEPKIKSKTYRVASNAEFHENGTMYLQGYQAVNVMNFSVTKKNGTNAAAFSAEAYGDAYVTSYELYDIEEPVVVHGGGSN